MNKELNIAYDILKRVYFENAYANIELNKFLQEKKDVNNSLVTKLVYGVLQKDIYLDFVVKPYIKPNTKPQIVLLLKMGRYASEDVTGIPTYALVNECVEIAKYSFDRYIGGFVNATLKNVITAKPVLPKHGTKEYLSVKFSYPLWIINKFLQTKPYDFVEAFLSENLTTLTHIRILGNVNNFVDDLKKCEIEYNDTVLDFSKYVDYNKLLKYEDIFKNRYVVQGLPSLIASLALNVTPNAKVLDATAAPGGKSAVIAGIDPSVQVTACDIHSHRVLLVENYMKKLGVKNVKALKQDATIFNPNFENAFDYVLCDVPCSGLGVVNKKPDILLNRTIDGLNEIINTQYKILENNSRYVKQNGVLEYSTCSLFYDENEGVVTKFLSSHTEFKLTEINTFGLNVFNNNLCYTFYPHLSKTEGFFIARMVKKWKYY